MPVSHKHKTILVHVPKSAGTSMEYVLGMHGSQHSIGVKPYVHQTRDKAHLFGAGLQHFTALELKKTLGAKVFDTYFTFAFTRNPWDRVVSDAAWSNGKSLTLKEPLTAVKLEAYVKKLARNAKQNRFTRHQRPQHEYVCDAHGDVMMQFLGKYENLQRDWQIVCAKLGVQLTLPQRMQSYHAHNYQHYYTAETRKLVASIYAKDITLFGYTF